MRLLSIYYELSIKYSIKSIETIVLMNIFASTIVLYMYLSRKTEGKALWSLSNLSLSLKSGVFSLKLEKYYLTFDLRLQTSDSEKGANSCSVYGER